MKALLCMFVVFLFIAVCHTMSPHMSSPAASASNEFLFSIWESVVSDDIEKNHVLSPWSISLGFAMLSAGAKGKTKESIINVFKWEYLKNDLHDDIKDLSEKLDKNFGKSLRVVSRLWTEQGVSVEQNFLDQLKDSYNTSIGFAEFSKNSEQAAEKINRWVAKQTEGKIKKLFTSFDDSTRLVLANAIYFRGKWSNKFPQVNTKLMDFNAVGGKIRVPTMNVEGQFYTHYSEYHGCQIIELQYEDTYQSMYILLPTGSNTVISVLEKVSNQMEMIVLMSRMMPQQIKVYLPKFHLTAKYELKEALENLGLEDVFSPSSDFSAISKSGKLSVSEAIHEADIEVNERGTEASGGTGINVQTLSLARVIRINRPFLFFITDWKNGIHLFAGVVNDPTKRS